MIYNGTYRVFPYMSLDMIAVEESFGENNVTLRLSLERIQNNTIDGLTYGVVFTSLFEEIIKVVPSGNDTSIELIVLYNVQYNLSILLHYVEFDMKINWIPLVCSTVSLEFKKSSNNLVRAILIFFACAPIPGDCALIIFTLVTIGLSENRGSTRAWE